MAFIGQEYCSDNFTPFTEDTPENWERAFGELHKLQPLGTDKEHFTIRGQADNYIFAGQICEKVRWFADIYDGNKHGVFVQFAISHEFAGYIHGVFDLFVKKDATARVTDVVYSDELPDSVEWDNDRGLLISARVAPTVASIPSIDIGLGVILYSDHERLSGYGFTLPLKNYVHSTFDTWTFSDADHGTAVVRRFNGTNYLNVTFELNGLKFMEKFGGSEVFAVRLAMASVTGNISAQYSDFMQSNFA